VTAVMLGLRQPLGRGLRPPVGQTRFWVVQAMVVGLAAAHLALDVVLSSRFPSAMPAGIPVALLVVPVSYAALCYGLAGSLYTGLWATVLWLPDLLLPHDEGHIGNDLIELGIVLAVAVFVGRHMDSERAARSRLEEAEHEHRLAEARVRRYAGLLLGAQEEERRHLAQELHDDPLQMLVYLARQLERLEQSPAVTPELARGIDHARQTAIGTVANLRSMVQGLRPPAIERLGLVAAIRGFVADVGDHSGLRCALTVTGAEHRLSPQAELVAFRIAQEAVHNAVAHADATHLGVTLSFEPARVVLQVADDGRGFDVRTLQATPPPDGQDHFGIDGMRERAGLLGGTLAIQSATGAGTTVTAVLPARPQLVPSGPG
jgi:signal transduction histidine kinase